MSNDAYGRGPRAQALTTVATLVALAVGVAGGPPGAGAEPVVNAKALPKGMTAEEAKAIAAQAKTRRAGLTAKREAEAHGSLQGVARDLDPLRVRLQEVAKGDSEYRAFLDRATKLLSDPSVNSRAAALNAHYRKGKDVVARAYKKAGGDPAKDDQVVVRYLKGFKPVPNHILAYFRQLADNAERNATIADEIRFTAPYAVHDAETEKQGPGILTVRTSVSNTDARMELSAEATSVGLLGMCRAQGTAGVFVDVPPGKTKLKVHVLYDYDYRAGVWAALGIGGANLNGFIDVFDVEANRFSATKNLEFENAVAVVAWYAEFTNDETDFVTLTTDVSPGKRYMVSFDIYASAVGMGGGGGGSFVTLTPTAIEVEFLD